MHFSAVWFRDTTERVVATFLEAALGLWILTGPGDLFSLSAGKGAAAAGVIAAAAVLKSAIAGQIGSGTNGSLDPKLVTVEAPAPIAKEVG